MKKPLFYSALFFYMICTLPAQQLSFERLIQDSFKSEFYLTLNAKYAKGDLDRDGDIDIILNGTVAGEPRTTVYFNDGLGNYGRKSDLLSVSQGSLELGDIDGDGDLDCILSGRTTFNYYQTQIMLNDGSGNFSYGQSNLPPMRFSATIFGDVDGDNDLDLFITGQGWAGKVHSELYLNNGAGFFSVDTNNTFIQLQYSDAIFLDIDNDTDLDIIYAGENSAGQKNTNVYLNNGLGDFTIDTSSVFSGTSFSRLVLADMDNDGDSDLWMLGYTGQASISQIMLYINNGNGLLELDTMNNFPNIDRAGITLIDLNNDNLLDVIFTGSLNNSPITNIYKSVSNGQFVLDTLNVLTNIQNGSIIPLDLNNDSFSDLVFFGNQTGFGSPISSFYLNDQNGRLNIRVSTDLIIPLRSGSSIHSDVDGDQDEDLFMSGKDINGNSRSLLYKNDGSGNFYLSPDSIVGIHNGESVFADLDQDFDIDLVISGNNNNGTPKTIIYLNDGIGNYIEDTSNILTGVYNSSIKVADFNNDGHQDIIIAGQLSNYVSSTSLYFGNNGNFTLDNTSQIKDLGFGSISVADIDNDNDLDFFISGEGIDATSIWNWGYFSLIYVNNGSGSFVQSTKRPLREQVSNGNSEFADIDNDGDYDLLYSGSSPYVPRLLNIYLNDGLGDFRPSQNFFNSTGRSTPILADLDNDNDLDIIINENYISTIYLNDSLGQYFMFQDQLLTSTQDGSCVYFDIDGDNDLDILYTGESLSGPFSSIIYRNNLISKVGIEKRTIKDQFKLFPNPSKGVVSIVDENQEIRRLELYNLNGQLITSREMSKGTSHQIELPEQKGIYLLMIYTESNQSAQRVVKY